MDNVLNLNENLIWPYNNFNNFNNLYPINQYVNQSDYNIYNSCFCTKSYIRFLNALLDIPDIDIYLNEMLIVTNLKYGDFTKYLKLAPGDYIVTVYPSGTEDNPIFETSIKINRNLSYTGVLSGEISEPEEMSIFIIPEARENTPMKNMTAIKLINLSTGSPYLDLAEEEGGLLFTGLEYGDTSSNIVLPTGRYTLFLKESENGRNLITAPKIDLAPGMHYTLFVIGKYGEIPNLELIIPEDGVNYLDIC